ncbi:glycine oxidase ThiO [Porticoccus sp. W117]|uniref:glycine oxidase ThiO n=1 Tax=Porticoccus sp. W117 TaxID=3054777 RepID=UPI002593DA06|nr:glycine oxidase ThiO [Porticoccus sp. W117]MDM3872424.1 glycine oxidase ThiO [Porticoccus sp. W117]
MNIAITGAGIIGRLLAWQLLEQGHKVTVFDRHAIDSTASCSYTAAGMLTPYSEGETAEPLVVALGKHALQRWPQLLDQLGSDVQFHSRGTLVVAHQQDRGDYQRFNNAVSGRMSLDEEQYRLLNANQLAELEPELAQRFQHAAYLPDESWLCSHSVMSALADKLQQLNVTWYANTEVVAINSGEVITKGRTANHHHFDLVIDCRGLGAKGDLPVRGVRGELLWIEAPEVNITRLVRLMHPRYRLYVVPRKGDLYLIGATQIESEDYSEISVRSALELLSAAYSVHPGFAEGRVLKSDVHCRPALPDNQPRIEASDGLIRVNGLFRHGYLISPAVMDEVMEVIADGNYQSEFDGLIH